MFITDKSEEFFAQAKTLMPGGVNSPVRAFKAVGRNPVFIKRGLGSKIYDVDDNQYIDYVCSWGPLILGHAYPSVIEAVNEAARLGLTFGAPGEGELELARLITEAIPSIDQVRMVNSGTEAAMSAVRLARAYTGRDKIVKFTGCYHGHADSFLINAGSGMMTAGIPSSPGVPAAFADCTLVADYNDLESVENIFRKFGPEIAAVIVEPIAGNMGLVLAKSGFLPGLRKITDQYGSLLIFDEVITGFRICYGGFQDFVNIKPDLTVLGKIIGGGMPVGAYGGRADIMAKVSPQGDVYQAGTLSGNPLAMAAGAATLKVLRHSDWYDRIDTLCNVLTNKLKTLLENNDRHYEINRIGSMFSLFFTAKEVYDYQSALKCDSQEYALFYRALLEQGVYFPPSQFEVCFVSASHSLEDIDETVAAVEKALKNNGRRDRNG